MQRKSKIAIIGASGLFPESTTKEEFWDNLLAGKDVIGEATEDKFGVDPQVFFHPEKGVSDKCYSLRGGYINGFNFDPKGYKLSADFLAKQDKSYHWSLHVAKDALADSGYLNDPEQLKKCGVILGNLSFPTTSSHKLLSSFYAKALEEPIRELIQDPEFTINGHPGPLPQNEVMAGVPSKMVSDALGLHAHHFTLDAACATSLYAIKLACDDLLTGKMDLMLAGAISASAPLFIHMGFSIFHALAPTDKKFAPLDNQSAGLVSSEGAGMVALKRLSDAERDGDQILGVIGGIGLSNDGRGKFLLSPHPKGQQLAFERAYENNQINPAQTSYLECHATGTPLGDTTELNSIADFFKPHGNQPWLGSVKSNMGHLLTAAGMPGLMKVLGAMKEIIIPPSIHIDNPISSKNNWMTGDQMVQNTIPWNEKIKQAGINSFGFGGTNAHMVVQEYTEQIDKSEYPEIPLQPMAIIGMDAHFGDCVGLDEFYNTIYHGRQHFKKLPATRWKGIEENKSLLEAQGLAEGIAPKGAYIEDFEIDLLRYKIQPNETDTLESQQALILKVADQAIQDAQLNEGENVAVLIAMEPELANHHTIARWDAAWQVSNAISKQKIELSPSQENELTNLCRNALKYREGAPTPSQHTSFVGNLMACRISALWDFSGPSFTVSSGENSAFSALEIAQKMLSLGDVDAVVVGAVDFSGGIENVMLRNQKDPLNTNKKPSISLDEKSNGWLIGEGAGAIVLKRSKDIQKEKVYSIVDEINQLNGKTESKKEIGYTELAATGIVKQDDQEISNLIQSPPTNSMALGSVKGNIGHTFAASGMASIIKTALCLHHRFIPGVPNWRGPKKVSTFEKTKYYFPAQSRPWVLQNGIKKRNAQVYGIEGMQVTMSEGTFQAGVKQSFLNATLPYLFPLKGESEKQLTHQLSALEIAIQTDEPLDKLAKQFYDRSILKEGAYCISLVAKNKADLENEINYLKKQLHVAFKKQTNIKTPAGSFFTPKPLGKNGKVAFVYPGSATAHPGLGQDTFQIFPELYGHFEQKNMYLDSWVQSDYLYPKLIKNEEVPFNIYEDAVAMMSAGVFYAGCATYILQDLFNLKTDLAFGYSMGETSSMWYGQGVWGTEGTKVFQSSPIFKTKFTGSLETLAEYWGVSSEEAQDRWTSVVLLAPKEEVSALVKKTEDVFLTFINTDSEVIISGDKDQCAKIVKELSCRSINVPFQNIIHHPFCNREREGLLEMHHFDIQKKPEIAFYSSILKDIIPLTSEGLAENSTQVCCRPVDFPANVKALYDKGARIFVEVGAGTTCTKWVKSILKNEAHHATSISQKRKADGQALIELLAQLTSHDVNMDISLIYQSNDVEQKGKTFLKKIIPGGNRMHDFFLKEENKAHFSSVNTFSKKKQLVHSDGSFESESNNQIQKTFPNMESIVEKPINQKSDQKLLGENGLPLQDFEAGEQFEGKEIVFSQQDLETFATGKIADVFGPEYSIIDTYPRRVMLPMYPYLLVSRVTGLKGKVHEYKPSTMQTEYDIAYDSWFTTDKQIPTAVCVESGQCDLLLISYLGIDFQNKGELVYRLLDCTLTFVDDLPYEGQSLRYDISINSFVRNGENLLFFFSYRCYVHDRLVLKMDGGCAGFFDDEQLQSGKGVVYSDSEIEARKKIEKKHFIPLLTTDKTAFSKQDLVHLINGDIEKCFDDPSYFANNRNTSLRLPPQKILMLDRITSVDLKGGAYGLGYIVAEKDLHPDDWYFPCHFRDDEVLAGSLQAEGGGNLLRVFMLMLGMQKLTKDARFQPVFDVPQKVRCRKQVKPTDTKLVYKLEIKEIGLVPYPYVIGDLEIISDGVITVHFENLGLQIREKDNPRYLETEPGIKVPAKSDGALLNEKDITTFALGNLADCFGPDFAGYEDKPTSRQPNTDLQLISRVLKIEGERLNFSKPSTIYSEYDVPVDAWYYTQNSAPTMPYSILMEVALQPCGLMSAYLGSTLQFKDKSLFFRNLDGEGTMIDLPYGTDFRGKTISNKSVMKSSISLGGTVIQQFSYELSLEGKVFYKGTSSFGFFPKEALAVQVGLDDGKRIDTWLAANNLPSNEVSRINLDSPYGKLKLYRAPENKPNYKLATEQLNLLDHLSVVKKGGKYGHGYVHATKAIKPYEWFFYCHFYQDPVMPGSLGIEAMMQAIQVFALKQDLGKEFNSPKFEHVENHQTKWKYRGQILRHVAEMELEIHIKEIRKQDNELIIITEASLWNDEVRIYEVTDLAIRIVDQQA